MEEVIRSKLSDSLGLSRVHEMVMIPPDAFGILVREVLNLFNTRQVDLGVASKMLIEGRCACFLRSNADKVRGADCRYRPRNTWEIYRKRSKNPLLDAIPTTHETNR